MSQQTYNWINTHFWLKNSIIGTYLIKFITVCQVLSGLFCLFVFYSSWIFLQSIHRAGNIIQYWTLLNFLSKLHQHFLVYCIKHKGRWIICAFYSASPTNLEANLHPRFVPLDLWYQSQTFLYFGKQDLILFLTSPLMFDTCLLGFNLLFSFVLMP